MKTVAAAEQQCDVQMKVEDNGSWPPKRVGAFNIVSCYRFEIITGAINSRACGLRKK